MPPLSPADVAQMLSLPAADAFDAYLVSGGLPLILDEWPTGTPLADYLAEAVPDPTSALLVSGERALAAEFPPQSQAGAVLRAIGSGERTFSLISRAAGGMPVADPHLRFWLSFLGPYLSEIERGCGDLTLARIKSSWTSWRGRAIEPVIRESLRRLPEGYLPKGTAAVGGYWTRTNDPEIDLVGADREPIAKRITFVGSVKWLESRPFDSHDLARLMLHRARLPGADDSVELLAVSRSGATTDGVRVLGPEDLLTAYARCA